MGDDQSSIVEPESPPIPKPKPTTWEPWPTVVRKPIQKIEWANSMTVSRQSTTSSIASKPESKKNAIWRKLSEVREMD